ncbi:MAG: hypothetical protein OQL17_07475 [Sedimenticola sp.]|uniref:Uncharacterized protein n=1 Tax=Sedimenticola thiotaurini TaxID=1543721 RepID=A0A558D467_9GAMM|nr:hypothetical protein [Sedimenticola sp.]TVT55799.1 MAG: hypothetical protein FHK82_07635 [Sedimenticola thiotaurini]MCW8919892.1 hypothetical protein [Sedimenticola sp.]MCW8949809.1 hypothetical protein [Sedimenticola sp.]MCW8974815.1 hypothetical protein [Sedimenticola sp.]
MKISVDITPEEMRTLMGWPDVQGLHEEMINKIREQMNAGAEGYDPLSLMQPFFTQSANSMESLQKMFAGMMSGYGKKTD